MRDAKAIVDQQFLEMRYRCLSLAADFDRIQRGEGGAAVLAEDPRLRKLRTALQALAGNDLGRAEQVLMIFSDMSPPPGR